MLWGSDLCVENQCVHVFFQPDLLVADFFQRGLQLPQDTENMIPGLIGFFIGLLDLILNGQFRRQAFQK